jgi:hypothetical protein
MSKPAKTSTAVAVQRCREAYLEAQALYIQNNGDPSACAPDAVPAPPLLPPRRSGWDGDAAPGSVPSDPSARTAGSAEATHSRSRARSRTARTARACSTDPAHTQQQSEFSHPSHCSFSRPGGRCTSWPRSQCQVCPRFKMSVMSPVCTKKHTPSPPPGCSESK